MNRPTKVMIAAGVFGTLATGDALGRSRPQLFRGELAPEVKEHLREKYSPADPRSYFKERKAQEVDLNNDGIFDLIVEADEVSPAEKKKEARASRDKESKEARESKDSKESKEARESKDTKDSKDSKDAREPKDSKPALPDVHLSVFEKAGARYIPIGEITCSGDAKWRLGDGHAQWEQIVCNRGPHYVFDEKTHAYQSPDVSTASATSAPQGGAATGGATTADSTTAMSPMFKAGLDLYKQGRWAEAAEKLEAGLGEKPSDEMLNYVGLANEKAHQMKRAREILSALGKKGYLPAELGLGDIAWEDGDGPAAIAHYQAWIQTNPPEGDDLARAQRRVGGQESPPKKKVKRAE